MTLQRILKQHLIDNKLLDSVAYVRGNSRHTYEQLFRHAAQLRQELMREAQGSERGQPVLVCGHKEAGMLAGFLACIASGRPFVPIDESLPASRVQQIAAITNARHAIICNDRVSVSGMTLVDGRQNSNSTGPLENESNADDTLHALFDHAVSGLETVYIIFTSGSTGEPKGVKIPMEALDDFLDWTVNSLFPNSPTNKVWMNQAVLSFDLSVFELWTSVATGGTVVALDSNSNRAVRAVFRDLSKHGAQIWVSTPSYADLCLLDPQFTGEKIPTLEDFVFCGEPLGHQTASALKDRFPTARVWNLYGPTEATCATTGIEVTTETLKNCVSLPVGQPKPGTHISLEQGEIIISGANVSTGYINRPELTEQSFFEQNGTRSYRTGDLGEFDINGTLFCLGRIDSQIKLNGYRIELAEIENAMRALAEIDSAACVDLRENGKVTAIGCCYCGDIPDEQQLKKSLESKLPGYMIPSLFKRLDKLPLNNNGKIDRQAVRQLFT